MTMPDGGELTRVTPKRITDLAEFAADYIDVMRATPRGSTAADLITYAFAYFSDTQPSPRLLEALGLMFVDRLYRLSSELPFKDVHVNVYVATVTRYVLDVVRARGVRLFYILDNEIRQDRFEFAIELLQEAGFSVVTPYARDGQANPLEEVRAKLALELLAGRHVAYIEKDRSVDYLRPVINFASATESLVIFRNEVPTLTQVQQIASRRPSTLT